jgi:hypothetical protein
VSQCLLGMNSETINNYKLKLLNPTNNILILL